MGPLWFDFDKIPLGDEQTAILLFPTDFYFEM